jgi:hypothetical protein
MSEKCEQNLYDANDCYGDEEIDEREMMECYEEQEEAAWWCAIECLTVDINDCALCIAEGMWGASECNEEHSRWSQTASRCEEVVETWENCLDSHPADVIPL